jgi:hypothetical protein
MSGWPLFNFEGDRLRTVSPTAAARESLRCGADDRIAHLPRAAMCGAMVSQIGRLPEHRARFDGRRGNGKSHPEPIAM